MSIKCVGIDGTKNGWIVACINAGIVSINMYSTITEICSKYSNADCVIIDIPIGLPESNAQIRPDCLLRKLLKAKASSVFSTPCRQSVYINDYNEASNINHKILGTKLSKQSFAICAKIREVDVFLQNNPNWQNRLIESHPEFGFAILNDNKPILENKTTYFGTAIRISILSQYVNYIDRLINEISINPELKNRLDDVIDAICLAVLGDLGMKSQFLTIPETPQNDSRGLLMQIVYPAMK